jgi:2-methylcitrate dehydratase PrpD
LIQLRKKVNATLVRELNLGARVAVRMKDGTTYKGSLEAPKGDPVNPMSVEEIQKKFRDNARSVVSEKNIEALIGRINNLENLSDLKELFNLL